MINRYSFVISPAPGKKIVQITNSKFAKVYENHSTEQTLLLGDAYELITRAYRLGNKVVREQYGAVVIIYTIYDSTHQKEMPFSKENNND